MLERDACGLPERDCAERQFETPLLEKQAALVECPERLDRFFEFVVPSDQGRALLLRSRLGVINLFVHRALDQRELAPDGRHLGKHAFGLLHILDDQLVCHATPPPER